MIKVGMGSLAMRTCIRFSISVLLLAITAAIACGQRVQPPGAVPQIYWTPQPDNTSVVSMVPGGWFSILFGIALGLGFLASVAVRFYFRVATPTNVGEVVRSDPWVRAQLAQKTASAQQEKPIGPDDTRTASQ
jgi:hypothetical protein